MSSRSLRRLWLLAGCVLVVLVIWISLFTQGAPLYQADFTLLGLTIDKYEHALAYATLVAWFGQLGNRWRSWVGIAGLFLLMGLMLELLQGLSSYRETSTTDMIANALGVCIGLGMMATPLSKVLSMIEDHVVAR